jgi:hypothetical protein
LQCLEEMVGLAALEVAPVDPVAALVDLVALEVGLEDPEVRAEALGELAVADPVGQLAGPEDRLDTVALALMSPIRLCIIGDRCLMGCYSTSPSWLSCIMPGIFCANWIWVGQFRLRSWISSLPCLAVPSTPE